MMIYSQNDAFNSSSITYILTICSYGLSRFNKKCLLFGNSPLIMLEASGGCNFYNYFPRTIALLIHPKLISVHYFGYFIISSYYQAMPKESALHNHQQKPFHNTRHKSMLMEMSK